MLPVAIESNPIEGVDVPKDGTSQETVRNPQGSEQPQSSVLSQEGKVETKVETPTNPTETRKPSQFAQDRVRSRKEIESLKTIINDLSAKVTSMEAAKKSVPVKEETKEDIFTDEYIYKHGFKEAMRAQKEYFENILKDRDSKILNHIPQVLEQSEKYKLLQIEEKKAFELAEKSGVPFDKVEELILKSKHWSGLYEEDPVGTMELVITRLKSPQNSDKGGINSNGTTKAQMSMVVSGKPSSGGGVKQSISRINNELKELIDKEVADPALRNDPKHNERFEQLKDEYEKVLSAK